MCGIVGIVFADPNRSVDPSVLDAPLQAIFHRGPNGEGRLVRRGIAAGMRRLAIIDLAGGDQPIWNEDHTVAVLFNGEIYNYRELRAFCEARGHTFRTDSDTEVIVHLYEELGDAFAERLNGMFAICLFDERSKRTLLVRDRYGIKPLYLKRTKAGLAFASEIRAFVAMGIGSVRFEPRWAGDYLRFLWIPEPRTAWEGVTRLPPGTMIEIRGGEERPLKRWFKPAIAPGEESEAAVRSLLEAAVKRQLVAEVPVGVFLSGGLDSSLVAALATRAGARVPAHTIRILSEGGLDEGADDAKYAKEVANALGIEQHEHAVSADFVEWLPKIVEWTDDPIGDPALIHTFLICDRARKESVVLLSGMGADELNGGYRRHVAARAMSPLYALPPLARSGAVRGLDRLADSLLPFSGRHRALRRVHKLLADLPEDPRHLAIRYAEWTPLHRIHELGLETTSAEELSSEVATRVDVRHDDPLSLALAFDIGMYLPSHNLRYVDKMSMAASTEVRVPFLDHELAHALLGQRLRSHVRGGVGKIALRHAAEGIVPASVLRRPKVGFGAPVRDWLKGRLGEIVRSTVLAKDARVRDWTDASRLEGFLDGRGDDDLSYAAWALLTLELWARANEGSAPRASVFSA